MRTCSEAKCTIDAILFSLINSNSSPPPNPPDVLIIDSNKNYGGVNFTGLAHDIETHTVPGEEPGTRRITRRPRELPKVGDEIDTAYGNGEIRENI